MFPARKNDPNATVTPVCAPDQFAFGPRRADIEGMRRGGLPAERLQPLIRRMVFAVSGQQRASPALHPPVPLRVGLMFRRTACGLVVLAGTCPGTAAAYELLSAAVQARIGERTVLGQQSPESFIAYDLRTTWRTPLEHRFASGMTVGVWGLASLGVFEGPDNTAVAASAIPLLAVATDDARFNLDAGIGLALLSEHRFGDQDFGGPLQFALTVGLEAPLFGRIGLSYRFMHYSDAGLYGAHTIGADLHMAGLSYRF